MGIGMDIGIEIGARRASDVWRRMTAEGLSVVVPVSVSVLWSA